MPLYEYLCDACGERFDLIQKFTDPAPAVCPKCGKGPVERQQSSPAIQFKGSGFYITDYARKGATPSGEAGGKSSSSESASAGESGGDSKKTDSKKTDSKDTESGKTESKKTESKKADAAPASPSTSSTTSEKS